MNLSSSKITDAFIGFAVGDALGVPVENGSRDERRKNPVTGMKEFGVHNQPAGTWSDDSSLVFCTGESLCSGYNLEDIARQFSNWKNGRFWTPHGRVFDIGIQTNKAIQRIDRMLEQGLRIKPISEAGVNERENGNGSLMRILPLAFYLNGRPVEERFRIVREVSGLTHSHIRAVVGCFIYTEFVIYLINGIDKYLAYEKICSEVKDFLRIACPATEISHYSRILDGGLPGVAESAIQSSPYVVHSLEACFWCFLRGEDFRETVLQSINLGDDTDTIGALTGGLAGICYGINLIPQEWVEVLARRDDIMNLAERFGISLDVSR